jgi:hypothetical protein
MKNNGAIWGRFITPHFLTRSKRKTISSKAKVCCVKMNYHIQENKVIHYVPPFREYVLPISKNLTQLITNCPWCGAILPESLREEYFETLNTELNIDPDILTLCEYNLPKEFKTDEWWKKRGL